ncbi:MAG TPA: pseudouridine-5'-phosphate glycosidase, partial [Kiloniellales bacterium]|nr:pseudouridine-5'-phosphate glycosidase [Kiloniellales bacterium]
MSTLLSMPEWLPRAIAEKRPLVALESTAIAHGLPWPENFETLHEILAAVRKAGAEAVVIGITGGRLTVGLDEATLERFARKGQQVIKVSRRDLATAVASGSDGATTVAATMIAAARAGIHLFATGGIGGVHRSHDPAQASFDISADLYELARTPVCVISSGAKSILDLPRTLEMLESLGVPVVGYGTRNFPTFYSRDAQLPLRSSLSSPAEAAQLLEIHRQLELGGILIANPLPEAAAIPSQQLESWLTEALEMAEREGVTGAAVTPFLLSELHRRSKGRTLAANRALL